jgi:tetratricopeptide (TPR) repeat protein
LVFASFVGLLLLVYWPAIRGGFIWDDDAYVTNNPLLTASDGWQRIWFSAHHQSQFFPLVYTTLRLEHALWGLNPFGYHLVNVLLHAANAALVWVVLRRLARASNTPSQVAASGMGAPGPAGEKPAAALVGGYLGQGAWIAAALFAFHPVQVESVAWVTELKNTQSTLFYLLALLSWMRSLDDSEPLIHSRYWIALLFYLLALLSKTTACTFPAAMLLVPWMRGERIGRRRLLQVIPFVVLGVVAGVVSILWESHLGNYKDEVGQSLTLVQRVLIASRGVWFYAGKLAWPAGLTFSYPRWRVSAAHPANYFWLLGCLTAAAALWHWRARVGRGVIGGVVFFVAALSPLLGFIPLYTFRYSYVADHYQYVASIGLLTLAGAGLSRVPRVFRISVLVAVAFLTWKQAHIYHSQTTLWQDTVAKNPGGWMGHHNLGTSLSNEGQTEQSIIQYREALRLYPEDAEGHYDLGNVLIKSGQNAEAMAEFQTAIRLGPQDSRAYYNYGVALEKTGRTNEAIQQYEEAVRQDLDYISPRMSLGTALSQQRRFYEAITQLQAAVELDPGSAQAHSLLGVALCQTGQANAAIAQFQAALRLDPRDGHAFFNYAIALEQAGHADEAIQQYVQAIRLAPDFFDAHLNLGIALSRQRRFDETIAQFREAVRLSPNDAGARYDLGAMLRAEGHLDEAIEQFQAVLRLHPEYALAHAALGAVLLQKGRAKEAASHLEQALRLNPADAESRENLRRARK